MRIVLLVVLALLGGAWAENAYKMCVEVDEGTPENPPVLFMFPSTNPPTLQGEYASWQCESVPGEINYMMRKSVFDGMSFSFQMTLYPDQHCFNPFMTVQLAGTRSNFAQSRQVPGGWETDLTWTTARITPHTEAAAALLNSAAPGTCGSSDFPNPWQPGVTGDITQSGGCSVTGMTVPGTEYELVRQIKYNVMGMREHIEWGARPSDGSGLMWRPTSFSPYSMVDEKQCGQAQGDAKTVCSAVMSSSATSPPLGVSFTTQYPAHFVNERFVSHRCESTTGGLFLTRQIEFDTHICYQWNYYYTDPTCNIKAFTVRQQGTYYVNPGKSENGLQDTSEIEYVWTKMWITANAPSWNQMFNTQPAGTCGERANWNENVEQDVTATGGCQAIFQMVPLTVNDVMHQRYNNDLIYFGAAQTNPMAPVFPDSYGYAAVPADQCNSSSSLGVFVIPVLLFRY